MGRRARAIPTLLIIAALPLGLGACGGDDEQATDSVELPSDGQQGSEESTGGGSTDNSLDELEGLEDLTGMENLDECVAVAGTYAGLAMTALGGEDGAADAAKELEGLRDALPPELDDAIDTVADAYATVAEQGLIDGADALDTEEFKAADAEIQAYIDENCTPTGGNG